MAAYLDHHPYPASATLLVQSGPMTGSQIQVPESGLAFGRAAGSAGALGGDPALSRQHARLDIVGDQLVVEDVGSSNGTFLNSQPISGRQLVQRGDTVALGTSELQVLSTPTTSPVHPRRAAATALLAASPLPESGASGLRELVDVRPPFVAIVGRYLGRVLGVYLALAVLLGVLIVALPVVRDRFGLIVPIAVAAGLLALSSAVLTVVAYLRSATTRLSLRAGQLDIDRGLWRRKLTTINLRRLRRVTLDQTTAERFIEYGTLVVYPVDRAKPIRVTGLARGAQLRQIYGQLAALASASHR
jgi:hypothetical protein